MSEKVLKVSHVADGVIQLQINRPQALNALTTEVLVSIADALNAAANDTSVRAIVLTGNALAFAAGADIEELKKIPTGNYPEQERQAAWAAMRDFPKPIIAAVSGFALGGGCELMMIADIVIASRQTKLGLPEVNLGIIPGAGGTQRMTRLVGKPAAMKLALSGEFIDANEALRLGLVSEVSEPELYLERAIVLAKKIAGKSSAATRAIKSSILNAYELNLEQAMVEERRLFLAAANSADATEGISAFQEKRKADFPSNKSTK